MFYWILIGFIMGLLGFTEFYLCLLGFIRFYWALLDVSICFIGFTSCCVGFCYVV